jgi:copper transport protein
VALRRAAAASLLAAAALALGGASTASAHSALTKSDPIAGATLGASPTAVTLTFSERPQVSLAEIRVAGRDGAPLTRGAPRSAGSAALAVPTERLERGVYTVSWRVVSAVDGHASSGAFAFGVGVSPEGAALSVPSTDTGTDALEVVARWLLLAGLALLLGAAVAGAAGFGGSRGTDLRLAAAAWLASVAGVALLTQAQLDAAGSSLSELLDTPVGDALVRRGVAVAAAGAALLVAWRRPGTRKIALAAAALCALAAIAVHVEAGHAGAGTWSTTLTVVSQASHFAAAGIWAGGLAALLLGIRGEPSEAKAAAVRRFSGVALVAVVVVAATGIVRSVDELSAWGDLADSGYGRAIVAKVVLLALIVALASRHRRRNVPRAATDLRPLRRTSRRELVLAAGALATAALLGSLAPPVAGQGGAQPAIRASGSDFGTTLRVRLTAASEEPGPNSFTVRVEDYDSGDPVDDARVRLRFTPPDDPGEQPTTLALRRDGDGSYTGSGSNLAFDGRWRVAVLVERGADAVEVPLSVDVKGPENAESVLRVPGRPTEYTIQNLGSGYLRIIPDPERPGPSTVTVKVFTVYETDAAVEQIVVTTQAGDGPIRQRAVRRISEGTFEADVRLEEGDFDITVVARSEGDLRFRGVFELDVPRR